MPLSAEASSNDSVSQRRAKIVATLGPASNTAPAFRDLVRAGIDVVRLNFSHGLGAELNGARFRSRQERQSEGPEPPSVAYPR